MMRCSASLMASFRLSRPPLPHHFDSYRSSSQVLLDFSRIKSTTTTLSGIKTYITHGVSTGPNPRFRARVKSISAIVSVWLPKSSAYLALESMRVGHHIPLGSVSLDRLFPFFVYFRLIPKQILAIDLVW